MSYCLWWQSQCHSGTCIVVLLRRTFISLVCWLGNILQDKATTLQLLSCETFNIYVQCATFASRYASDGKLIKPSQLKENNLPIEARTLRLHAGGLQLMPLTVEHDSIRTVIGQNFTSKNPGNYAISQRTAQVLLLLLIAHMAVAYCCRTCTDKKKVLM